MEQTKQEKPISNTGSHVFDGNLSLRLKGKEIKVRCEYFGLDLQRASQEHQLIVLIKQHLPYWELNTGWLVRTKDMDKEHHFGLKAKKEDRHWSVYDYNDVVAWGYADGGLNSDHFNSCQMRPEECPDGLKDDEPDEVEWDDPEEIDNVQRRCVKFKVTDNEVLYKATVAADEEMTNNATDLMRDAADDFWKFRAKHPEVTEMHFYTDDEVLMPD